MKKFHRLMIIVMLSAFSIGCTLPAKVPMDTLYYEEAPKGGRSHLFVFLPGRGDRLGTYKKHGFIDAVRQKGLKVDMAEADAHTAYYEDGSIRLRLKEDVIGPAKAKGYKYIWLVGISMGGTGSLLYAVKNTDDISGVILFAPFLGDEAIINEMKTPRRRDSGVSLGKNYYLKYPPNPLLQSGVQGNPTAETVGY